MFNPQNERFQMYTLILVIYFASGHIQGGVAVTTEKIPGWSTEATCNAEGKKAAEKLLSAMDFELSFSSRRKPMPNEIKWHCTGPAK